MVVSEYKKPFWQKAVTVFIMVAPCIAVLFAAIAFSRSPHRGELWYSIVIALFVLVGTKARMYGISLGFHRGLTHKAYESKPWVRKMFLILGCMAMQGEPVRWATDHTEHHRYADKPGDPHSPEDGFWHAHWGWLINIRFDREINPTFKNDALAMQISKWTWTYTVVGLIIPAIIGQLVGIGWWDGFLWGGGVATFLGNQATYWVNSGAHTFGRRDFETDDRSTNFWLRGPIGYPISLFAAYITCGETNHNNHHAIGHAANHGMFKGQLDTSARMLRMLEKVGLVWNIRWATEEDIEKRKKELTMTPEQRKEEALRLHRERQQQKVTA